MDEIKDSAIFVAIGGTLHEMPSEERLSQLDDVIREMTALVENGGTFVHRPKNGPTSIVKLVPGMPVQVMLGSDVKRLVREQRQAAMMGAPQPGPRPRLV